MFQQLHDYMDVRVCIRKVEKLLLCEINEFGKDQQKFSSLGAFVQAYETEGHKKHAKATRMLAQAVGRLPWLEHISEIKDVLSDFKEAGDSFARGSRSTMAALPRLKQCLSQLSVGEALLVWLRAQEAAGAFNANA
jgi:hypothetical protein